MQTKFRRRLVYLVLSVLVMIVLFGLSVRRASENLLPPTPSPVSSEAPFTQADSTKIDASLPIPSQTASLPSVTLSSKDTGTATIETVTANIDSQSTAQAGEYKATQRARAMSDIVKGLYEDGAVAAQEGYYKQLDDFADSFNKPGYFRVSFTDYQAKYFVIRANVLWNNAGEEISYPTAGCGFIFGYQETLTQNRVVLTLDGNVRIQNISGGNTTQRDPIYYGELDKPQGHANLILAVDQGWITVYVNNQLITHVQEENLPEGWIGYAIEAGSSYGYGTSCEFKDIELWQFE